jgi:hypothetical protein
MLTEMFFGARHHDLVGGCGSATKAFFHGCTRIRADKTKDFGSVLVRVDLGVVFCFAWNRSGSVGRGRTRIVADKAKAVWLYPRLSVSIRGYALQLPAGSKTQRHLRGGEHAGRIGLAGAGDI